MCEATRVTPASSLSTGLRRELNVRPSTPGAEVQFSVDDPPLRTSKAALAIDAVSFVTDDLILDRRQGAAVRKRARVFPQAAAALRTTKSGARAFDRIALTQGEKKHAYQSTSTAAQWPALVTATLVSTSLAPAAACTARSTSPRTAPSSSRSMDWGEDMKSNMWCFRAA